MTLTELEKLEALHAAATPGRWSPYVWQGNDDTSGWAAVGPHQESTECVCEGEEARKDCKGYYCQDDRSQNDEEQAWEDAKAIAALHNAFPAMAKALKEAQAERDTLKAECASISEEFGLPPTIRPREGEIRRMLDGWKEARAEVERLKAELAESEELRLEWAKEVGRMAAQRADLRAEIKRLKDPGHVSIPQHDLYSFIHCAINYAFGRRTYITHTVPAQIRCYWAHLEPGQRETLTRNLKADIEGYNRSGTLIGDKCDDASWRDLLAWMESNP